VSDHSWTAETEELVAGLLFAADHPGVDWSKIPSSPAELAIGASVAKIRARLALRSLADAGLLVPVGGEVGEEWGVHLWADYNPAKDVIRRPDRESAEGVVAFHAARRAANPPAEDVTARRWYGNAELIRRTIHTGPWEVTTDG
jgi:hypothetical protein